MHSKSEVSKICFLSIRSNRSQHHPTKAFSQGSRVLINCFSIFWKANAIEARCTPLNGIPGFPGQDLRALPSVLAGNALTVNVPNMLTIAAWDCKPAFKPNPKNSKTGREKCIKWPASALQNVTPHGINACKHSDIFPCPHHVLRVITPCILSELHVNS
jgi:hypothetical protein